MCFVSYALQQWPYSLAQLPRRQLHSPQTPVSRELSEIGDIISSIQLMNIHFFILPLNQKQEPILLVRIKLHMRGGGGGLTRLSS